MMQSITFWHNVFASFQTSKAFYRDPKQRVLLLVAIDRFQCCAIKKTNRKPFSGQSQEIVIL